MLFILFKTIDIYAHFYFEVILLIICTTDTDFSWKFFSLTCTLFPPFLDTAMGTKPV